MVSYPKDIVIIASVRIAPNGRVRGFNRTVLATYRTETSKGLKSRAPKLIHDCLKPIPRDRPNVMELRSKIRAHRDAIVKVVREREGAESAKPSEDERLYYVGNEIEWAKTGDWQPHKSDRDSNKSENGFPDPEFSPGD